MHVDQLINQTILVVVFFRLCGFKVGSRNSSRVCAMSSLTGKVELRTYLLNTIRFSLSEWPSFQLFAGRYDDFGGSFADSSATLAQLEAVFKEVESHKNTVNHVVRPGIQVSNRLSHENNMDSLRYPRS